MSTGYGKVKCARYDNHTIEVYTSLDEGLPSIKLFSERDSPNNASGVIGIKVVLNQYNIDAFLAAVQCALKEKNIFSNYLNPEGKLHNE